MKHILAAAAVLLLTDIAVAHPEANHNESAAKVSAVAASARPAAAVVDAFHAALRRGDTKAALSYLADNALIYEAGRLAVSSAAGRNMPPITSARTPPLPKPCLAP